MIVSYISMLILQGSFLLLQKKNGGVRYGTPPPVLFSDSELILL